MKMSNHPSDNSHYLNDASERPISVYDNLSSTVNYPRKDDKKQNSIELPFSNISFKFDGGDADVTQNNVNNLVSSQMRENHNNESQRYSNTNSIIVGVDEPHQQDAKQYSDTNGKKSQEIVIDKPVISDAKSKFFGLVGNATDASESTKLLNSTNKDGIGVVHPQPQYQNLPSNSAIYRNKFRNSETSTSNQIGLSQDIATDRSIEDSTIKDYRSGTETHSNRSTKCYPPDTDFSVNHHPSQAVYMSTTVPQNIKSNNIAGRHTPTRNSLRHSRMLVINKNYQGFKSPNPLHLRYPRLMKSVLILQIILGVILTFIGVWILLWAPNTRIQDNPYWSGLALTLAGIFGIVLIRFKRIKRQKLRENCFTFIKIDSYVLALLASILCVIALACALIHLWNLMAESTKCTSTNILVANAACICTFGATKKNVTLTTMPEIKEDDSIHKESEFQYRDLSCSEVVGAWKYILIMSAILNGLGFIVTIAYLILLYCRRENKQNYSTVRTDNF